MYPNVNPAVLKSALIHTKRSGRRRSVCVGRRDNHLVRVCVHDEVGIVGDNDNLS